METKTCIVTGAFGQDGSYLTEKLAKEGHRVIALRRPGSRHDAPSPGVEWHAIDLQDHEAMASLINDKQPDEFYNLAALSNVGDSWQSPVTYANVNYVSVVHILEAIRRWSPSTHFYQASTSEIYGLAEHLPLNEKSPRHPRSPYAVSKMAAMEAVRNARESHGLFACNGILFNHESERRGAGFVTRRITLGLSQWVKTRETIKLGDVTARRDWGYAPDYVDAMAKILRHHAPDDFVAATGVDRSVQDFAEEAFGALGLDLHWEANYGYVEDVVAIEIQPKRFRPAEVPILRGDATKAKEVLGWEAKTPFKAWVGRMVRHDLRNAEAQKQTLEVFA